MKKTVWIVVLLISLVCCGCGQETVSLGDMTVSEENGSNNIPLGGLSVLGDNVIYYVGEGENGGELLCSMGLEGENEAVLYTPESNLDQISCLNYDGTALYFMETILDPQWLSVTEHRIRKYDLQSGEVTTLGADPTMDCLTYHDGNLYYTAVADMQDGYDGCSRYLFRLSVDGGNAKKLGELWIEDFVIIGDRIWCAPNSYHGCISSWDLNGENEIVHYTTTADRGLFLYAIHNGCLYFHEYAFEAPGQNYCFDLSTGNRTAMPNAIVGECNTIGDIFCYMTKEEADVATSGDLTAPSSSSSEDVVSGADLQKPTPVEEFPASESDLDIDQFADITITPGSATLKICRLDAEGEFVVLDSIDYPGQDVSVRDLGTISGHWNFYSVPESYNGRTLYKEKLLK